VSVIEALDVALGDLLAAPTLMDWTAESGQRTMLALREALMDYRRITPLLDDGQSRVEPPAERHDRRPPRSGV
jgi:hypothetical protein